MKALTRKIFHQARRLARDEQGADMIEYVLIIAAVALPLLALILIFKDRIIEWWGEETESVMEHEQENPF